MLMEIYMKFEGVAADKSFLRRLCLNSDVRAMPITNLLKNVTGIRISENDDKLFGENTRSMNLQLWYGFFYKEKIGTKIIKALEIWDLIMLSSIIIICRKTKTAFRGKCCFHK